MKSVIDKKLYDTDTAEKIASWGNGLSTSDFNYCEESLYLSPEGDWFLHGTGGDMTALSRDEVIGWLSAKDAPKVIEEYFIAAIELA